jgi:hypothetical protein
MNLINPAHIFTRAQVKIPQGYSLGDQKIQKRAVINTVEAICYDHFGSHNNNWLITLSGGYKNLHCLTQFIVTTFYVYKKTKFI